MVDLPHGLEVSTVLTLGGAAVVNDCVSSEILVLSTQRLGVDVFIVSKRILRYRYVVPHRSYLSTPRKPLAPYQAMPTVAASS
jgi:hypothetical protein